VKNFIISDRVLPLEVRVNPRAKRLILRFEPRGQVLRITIPVGTTERQIDSFLEKCAGWIEERLKKFPLSPCEGSMLRDGVKIPYLGQPHLIVHQGGRGLTCLSKNLQGEGQILVTGQVAHLPRRLADFFKAQARATLVPMVMASATKLGRPVKTIQFKDTKSRWGSCSATGGLSFSWRIMMAPLPVVRYLVAHEVAHLAEMNHGERFWQICTELCPQTQKCRSWLKRNGQALQSIDFT